ncbi:MAG: glycosyl hydrolase [Terriglobia bacterium]
MKRRTFIQSCAGGALTLLGDWRPGPQAVEAADMEQAFRNPPVSAGPHNYWPWMNGNISQNGITRDLEAMKRVGVKAFQIFQIGSGVYLPQGPVNYGSPEHLRLLKHAAREADRLGLGFAMHNCPGWSSSGGPWITPELSMQVLTWTETPVAGGQVVNTTLPQPFAKLNYYRDAMLLAYPAQPGEARPMQELLRSVTSSSGPVGAKLFTDGDPSTFAEVHPAAEGQSAYLQLEFAEPFEARSITLSSAAVLAGGSPTDSFDPSAALPIALEASDDGAQFRKVCEIGIGRESNIPTSVNFAATRVRFFRLVSPKARRFSEIRLSGASRIPNWTSKANIRPAGNPAATAALVETPGGPVIDPASVLDIGRYMDPQGRLNWLAPAGSWTILRIGHTTTGAQNAPAPDGSSGLECDKFSKTAYDFHFNHFFGELFDAIAPLAAKGMAGATIDSYEVGLQNWTAEFPQEFQKRRGYDLRKYMPAMFGRVVASVEESERFLWDIRKTHAELMEKNYYGCFAENCHRHGMKAFFEPYDPGNFDEMPAGAYADMVMGEFWLGLDINHSIKLAASVGHVNGKRVIAAESFTSAGTRWLEYPYCMKTTGDFMFAQGLNQYVFHRYCHQPHPDVLPGMTMGPWGWHWERTNTWFEKAKTWLEYVSRCQTTLRQGMFVADLLYFTGENSPQQAPGLAQLEPPPPPGYDWDTIDSDAIKKRLKIEDGRIVLPDGMSYRVLVLRNEIKLSLGLLSKISELVKQGMWLVGPKPKQSPSLSDNEEELRRIAGEVWGDLNGTTATERTCGKGRVFWGQPLRAVLDKLGLKSDFEFTAKAADAPINYLHRRVGDAEVYFVAGRRRQSEELVCTFRVEGKQPEVWNPVTGEIAQVATYEVTDGRTRVPVRLDPAGSLFVVFRSPAGVQRLESVAKDDTTLVATQPFPAPAPGRHRDVTNNFTMSVWVKPDMDAVMPDVATGSVANFWSTARGYIVYPPAGEKVYGAGHAACGFNAGRNGVALYERATGNPTPVLSAHVPLAGWTHLAVVYKEGAPSVYVNGRQAGQGKNSGKVVHPGLGEAYQSDGAFYYMGHMSEPELFNEVLDDARIQQLAAAGIPNPEEPPAVEPAGGARPELLFWQDGIYSLRDSAGRNSFLKISGIDKAVDIKGPWKVTFPPNLGAPPEITLPKLTSLHRHPETGVKYFSGTATYSKRFNVPADAKAGGKRLYLDLGRVEVIAEVKLNGKPIGSVWKPPYRLDITDAVRSGDNDLEIQVVNLWPNRLIGDEQLPPEYEYGGKGDTSSFWMGSIKKIPDWYAQGKPKPPSQRVTFCVWRHYNKDEPLLESGLIGPVRLRTAVRRAIEL